MTEFEELLERPLKAKFRINLYVGSKRSVLKVFPIGLALWEYGGAIDRLWFFCPTPECSGLFSPDLLTGLGQKDPVMCPKCKKVYPKNKLCDSRIYVGRMDVAVQFIMTVFHDVNGQADFCLHWYKKDIRFAGEKEKYGTESILATSEHVVYSLQSIIRDTSAGQSLESILKGFLRA